ncbi:MAG TPA: TolC family protein, partial [Lentimicrobium sp.]|nr:TolC family protein [Lentimicrobium sp.]
KSQVSLAMINARSAEISEQSTLNQLRKNIETARAAVVAAGKEFQASEEQYRAMTASYEVATERFNQGVISPVDYLFEKTNLINAESKLLQSRYNLIFSYKELEYYQGKPLTL